MKIYFFTQPKIWDRCYDFLNIFAKNRRKNWRFELKIKLNLVKKN
jgi:hypothetical protein